MFLAGFLAPGHLSFTQPLLPLGAPLSDPPPLIPANKNRKQFPILVGSFPELWLTDTNLPVFSPHRVLCYGRFSPHTTDK